ncbi:MAG: ARMT1-like domain-containing protein, partial [candidate division WOR-3 bacterium]|nr:ARMT1-like domain-containing protein [candidate division WOR-3 bacterium]
WQTLDPEVRKLMQEADIVIVKGHANFESLIDGPQEAFLLLKIKCQVVAEKIREDCGSLVCMHYIPQKNASPSFGDPG